MSFPASSPSASPPQATTRSVPPAEREAEAAKNSKLHRTDVSYGNEIAFLNTHAAALSDPAGPHRCRVARPLLARAAEGGGGFFVLMESHGPGTVAAPCAKCQQLSACGRRAAGPAASQRVSFDSPTPTRPHLHAARLEC